MKSFNREKILSGVLIIVVIIAGIYYYNLYGPSLGLVSSISSDNEAVQVGEDVLVLVQKLDGVKIDESVFASPLFTYLKDTTISINPEEKSRPNPFAPISGSATGKK